MILERLSMSQEKITFSQFDKEFFISTKQRFEDVVDALRRDFREEQWTSDVIFRNLSMLRHSVDIEFDEIGGLVLVVRAHEAPRSTDNLRNQIAPAQSQSGFVLNSALDSPIFVIQNAETPQRMFQNDRGDSEHNSMQTVQNPRGKLMISGSGDNGHIVGKPPTDSSSSSLQNSGLQIMTSSDARTPPLSEGKKIEIWPDVSRLFQEPCWPRVSAEFRKSNLEVYENFLKLASGRDSKDIEVLREAKRLAFKWWGSRLRNFPQLIYLLKLISEANPDGFDLQNIHQEVETAYPKKWLRWNCMRKGILLDFHASVSDLVELNLIVQCDSDNPHLFKINKVLEIVAMHQITDPDYSLIYQIVSESGEEHIAVSSVNTNLLKIFNGWAMRYNESTGCERIREICEEKHKMFSISEQDGAHWITVKDHAYKIPLPMCFHSILPN